MEKAMIENVIKGFNLPKETYVALNYWGSDDETPTMIKTSLEKAGHNVYLHRVRLNKMKKDALEGTLHLSDDVITAIASCDVSVDVFSHPVMMPEGFPEDKIKDFKMFLGKLFQAMSNEKRKFIQWRLPTTANSGPLDSDIYTTSMRKACMVDYDALYNRALRTENFMKGRSQVHIKNDKTDFKFLIGTNQWHKDVGDGDIPAGEIYCVPERVRAEGTVFVPFLKFRELNFSDIQFNVKDGVFTTDHKSFNDFISKFDDQARLFCEFGVGLNDAIEELIGDQLHDEKKMDTIHLGIGNNKNFGGDNESKIHIDLVIAPDTVTVDEQPLIEKGRLLIR